MKELENFIRTNTSEFNSAIPDKEGLWDKISAELKTEEERTIPIWKRTYRWAAVFLVILGLGSFLQIGYFSLDTQNSSSNTITTELKGIDAHYQGLVSSQVALLLDHPGLSEDSKSEFLSFLDELDEEYNVLRKELDKGLDNEIVLEAIISNYQKRIELIQKLLLLLEDTNIKEDENAYTL